MCVCIGTHTRSGDALIRPARGWLWKLVILRLSDRSLIPRLWYDASAEEPRTARPTSPTQAPRIAAIDLRRCRGLEDRQPRYDSNNPRSTSATRTQLGRRVALSQLRRATRTSTRWYLIGRISRAMSRPKGGELSDLAIGPFVFNVVMCTGYNSNPIRP